MSEIKFELFKGLVEIVSAGELSTPPVYAIAFLLVAVGITIAFSVLG